MSRLKTYTFDQLHEAQRDWEAYNSEPIEQNIEEDSDIFLQYWNYRAKKARKHFEELNNGSPRFR